jgi:hypothetical protein
MRQFTSVQHSDPHHLYKQWCLRLSAVGLASRYGSRPKQLFKSCYWVNLGSTKRKAPVFLRGLFQLIASLVELEGLEPSTSCLQIRRPLFQTVPDAPFAQFDLYSKPLKPAPHCPTLPQAVSERPLQQIYNKQRQSLGILLIGLPLASWSPKTMVKSPKMRNDAILPRH